MTGIYFVPLSHPMRTVSLLLFIFPTVLSQQLTDELIGLVSETFTQMELKSWEIGTYAQAILSLNATSYSVYTPPNNNLPPPGTLTTAMTTALEPVFNISRIIVGMQTKEKGPKPFIPDGSAADPASIGVAVLLSDWTGQSQVDSLDYAQAVKDQLEYLLHKVPHSADGAISHRGNEVQLWSDSVYMVPPFLALAGLFKGDETLMREAHNQIRLYREHLRDEKTGLWYHIRMGTENTWDENFWVTGHGWAALGMLRVWSTYSKSSYSQSFQNEMNDLEQWVKEIHTAVYASLPQGAIFTNYIDKTTPDIGKDQKFPEAASTAIIAASVYRAATLLGDESHISFAEESRKALSARKESGEWVHFDDKGYLRPVVNPRSFREKGMESAEGQAFVLEMHAAWMDWTGKSKSGSETGRGIGGGTVLIVGWVTVVVVIPWSLL